MVFIFSLIKFIPLRLYKSIPFNAIKIATVHWHDLIVHPFFSVQIVWIECYRIKTCVHFFSSVWAQPEGTIQTEAESGREEEQPNAQEKRWKYHDSIQEEGSGANGYAIYSIYSICIIYVKTVFFYSMCWK